MEFTALSRELKEISYAPQVQFVDRGIRGEGFYPGASQCLFGDPGAAKIMLLGRDFGTLDYYSKLQNTDRSEYALTWRHTRDIYLKELNLFRVFCTNYLMGVRVDGSAKGDLSERMKPAEWSVFEESCWLFLLSQASVFRPDLILVFGADNKRDLQKPSRLSGLSVSVLYGDHPHSAIGSKNAARHTAICKTAKARLGLADK